MTSSFSSYRIDILFSTRHQEGSNHAAVMAPLLITLQMTPHPAPSKSHNPPQAVQTLCQLAFYPLTCLTSVHGSPPSSHSSNLPCTFPPQCSYPDGLPSPPSNLPSHLHQQIYSKRLIDNVQSLFQHSPSSAGLLLSIVLVPFHYTVKVLLFYRFFESEVLSFLITAVSWHLEDCQACCTGLDEALLGECTPLKQHNETGLRLGSRTSSPSDFPGWPLGCCCSNLVFIVSSQTPLLHCSCTSLSLFNLCPRVTPFQNSGSSIPRQIKQEAK